MSDNLCESGCGYSKIVERKYAGDIKTTRTVYCLETNEIIKGVVVECHRVRGE